MKSFTVKEINDLLQGELIGNTSELIEGPEELKRAERHQITFIGSSKYVSLWKDSKASVAIINENLKAEPGENRALIKVENADLAMAKVLEAFNPEPPVFDADIHSTAVIHVTAKIGKGCKVGSPSYIGKNVVIGDGALL